MSKVNSVRKTIIAKKAAGRGRAADRRAKVRGAAPFLPNIAGKRYADGNLVNR